MYGDAGSWADLAMIISSLHAHTVHTQPSLADRTHSGRDGLPAHTPLHAIKAASTGLVKKIFKEQYLRRSVASGPGEHVMLVMDLSAAQPTMAHLEGMTVSRIQYRCSWLSMASRSCRGHVMSESDLSVEHVTTAF